MTSSGVESDVRPRGFRWSLRALFIAVTLISALFALIAIATRPERKIFNDPLVLRAMASPDRVELYDITSWVDVANGDTSTNGEYPVFARPVQLNKDEWASLRTALTDRDTYLVVPEDVRLSYVVENEYRVRLYNRSNILDFEIALSHVEVVHDGEPIHFAFWADDRDELILDLCNEVLATKSIKKTVE